MRPRWTALHSATFVHLYVAESTDGHLDASERRALVAAVRRWGVTQGLGDAAIDDILLAAGTVYAEAPDREDCLSVFATHLLDELPRPVQRLALFRDLRAVARADGRVTREEQAVLDSLRDRWGLAVFGPMVA